MDNVKMMGFLQSLDLNEATRVLWALLDEDTALIEKAYGIAVKMTEEVDADGIAEEVYIELDALDVDDLYSRSGNTRYGYVDPNDEAYEMFEEALSPFINDMKRDQKRGLNAAAKYRCVGMIKGLVRFDEESCSEFSDWVVDAPGECVESVMEEWKKGDPTEDDIAEVSEIVSILQS